MFVESVRIFPIWIYQEMLKSTANKRKIYPTCTEENVVRDTEEFMQQSMARFDPSHDAHHVHRVRKTALAIARAVSPTAQRQPDLLIVELAALLHDVLDKKYHVPSGTDHQLQDAFTFLTPFFQSLARKHGVDLLHDGRAQEIAKIVDNVSWSTEKKLTEAGALQDWHRECLELHCVQDADRLDAIGAFGIMRCAAYSAVTNHPLHVPPGHPRQGESAIQHFHDKLLHVQDRLKTKPGQEEGARRHNVMIEFLKSIDEEYTADLP